MNGATQAAIALLFLRGLVIVGLTSANVAFIAHHSYGLAALSSYGISVAWWSNSRETHRSRIAGARWIYAAGAATGTLLALLVTR